MDNIKKILEEQYSFSIIKIEEAPRSFVAETFFITTSDNKEYFLKIIKKRNFIKETIASLPLIQLLDKQGIQRIAYPLPTKSGTLYLLKDNKLLILFNKILGKQSYNYSLHTFGKLLAKIHDIKNENNSLTPKENYKPSSYHNFFWNNYKIYFETKRLNKQRDRFNQLSEIASTKKANYSITHGDAGGNVLVGKSESDIHIIDWDAALWAHPERDLWVSLKDEGFLEGYHEINPNFEPDEDLLSYYTYYYYFNSLGQYLYEAINGENEDYRNKNLSDMKNFITNGWIKPYLNPKPKS